MDLGNTLKEKLREYRTNEFWIDEHARKRCQDYIDLELDEVLERLRRGKFDRVVRNDSKKGSLEQYESFKVRIPKSNKYKYEVVLYLTGDKPLIKTVSLLDRKTQKRLDQ